MWGGGGKELNHRPDIVCPILITGRPTPPPELRDICYVDIRQFRQVKPTKIKVVLYLFLFSL